MQEKTITTYLIRHLYTSIQPGTTLHVFEYVRPPLPPRPVCSRQTRLVASPANSIGLSNILLNKKNLREESW